VEPAEIRHFRWRSIRAANRAFMNMMVLSFASHGGAERYLSPQRSYDGGERRPVR
jgi:hypothetical protein